MKFHKIFLSILLVLFVNMTYAQDWQNLGKYRAENEKLAPPSKNENRVVFIGNSITEGWKKEDSTFFKINPYINRGIGGQTSPQILLRFRTDAIHLQPKVVVILTGTNDIAGNTGPSTLEMIVDNIASMTEIAKANHITPIICSLLPAYDFWWKKGVEPAEKIVALNKLLKAFAEKNNILYVDYHTPMKDEKNGLKKEYGEDGVHPNLAGYKIMEPLIQSAIAKALKKK